MYISSVRFGFEYMIMGYKHKTSIGLPPRKVSQSLSEEFGYLLTALVEPVRNVVQPLGIPIKSSSVVLCYPKMDAGPTKELYGITQTAGVIRPIGSQLKSINVPVFYSISGQDGVCNPVRNVLGRIFNYARLHQMELTLPKWCRNRRHKRRTILKSDGKY